MQKDQPIKTENYLVIGSTPLDTYSDPLSDDVLSDPQAAFSVYSKLKKIRSKHKSEVSMGRLVAVESLGRLEAYETLVSDTSKNLGKLGITDSLDSISILDYYEMYKDSGEIPEQLVASLQNIKDVNLAELYIFTDGLRLHLIDKAGTIKSSAFDISVLIAEAIDSNVEPSSENLSEFFENLDSLIGSFKSCIKSPEKSLNRRTKGSETIHRISQVIYTLKTSSEKYLSTEEVKKLLLDSIKESFSGKYASRTGSMEEEFDKRFSSAMNELNSHLLLEAVLGESFTVRQGTVDEDRRGGDSIATDSKGYEVYFDWKSNIANSIDGADGPINTSKVSFLSKNIQGQTRKLDLVIKACHRSNRDNHGPQDKYKFTIQLQNLGKEVLFDELVDWRKLFEAATTTSIPIDEVVKNAILGLMREAQHQHSVQHSTQP